jgi:hypothetical protein
MPGTKYRISLYIIMYILPNEAFCVSALRRGVELKTDALAASFNHLVCLQQNGFGNRESQRFRSLEVDK